MIRHDVFEVFHSRDVRVTLGRRPVDRLDNATDASITDLFFLRALPGKKPFVTETVVNIYNIIFDISFRNRSKRLSAAGDFNALVVRSDPTERLQSALGFVVRSDEVSALNVRFRDVFGRKNSNFSNQNRSVVNDRRNLNIYILDKCG